MSSKGLSLCSLLVGLLATPGAPSRAAGSVSAPAWDGSAHETPLDPSWASVKEAVHEPNEILRKYRQHPDLLGLRDLVVGQKVVVTPDAFRYLPSLMKRLKGPIAMEVVRLDLDGGTERYRGKSVVYLKSPETGQVGVPSYWLQSSVYATMDFQAHAPFVKGEYVQLGTDWEKASLELEQRYQPGQPVTISSSALPYLGRFVGVADEEHYEVEVEAAGQFLPRTVLAPKTKVEGLISGTRKAASALIDRLPLPSLAFRPGERVRYRDAKGRMCEGGFRASAGGMSEVGTEAGANASVPSGRLFKVVGDIPALTSFYDASWQPTRLNLRDPLVAEFLDYAAKLTSHPDYLQVAPTERLKLIVSYVQRSIPWSEVAIRAEPAGVETFAKLITAGVSVCRHNAYLLGVILSETGYATRLVKHLPPQSDGHAWLEVDMRQPGGSLQTYVVDPSNKYEPVSELAAVMQAARDAAKAGNSESAAVKWYLQPGREYVLPRPL
ncbi:MAG: transglutaminase domain-containing protein [Elusimicrobia bacterium]|nr:transglutaminase domain-containing protein [Elusimicrobiota bacterium]